MKILLLILFALLLATSLAAQAKDLHMAWDPSTNATGYQIQISTNLGQTWGEIRDGNGTRTDYWWLGAPETGMLLFRVGAKGAGQESWNMTAGAWYNGSWDLSSPKGTGIK
jgi:hypothetical protein